LIAFPSKSENVGSVNSVYYFSLEATLLRNKKIGNFRESRTFLDFLLPDEGLAVSVELGVEQHDHASVACDASELGGSGGVEGDGEVSSESQRYNQVSHGRVFAEQRLKVVCPEPEKRVASYLVAVNEDGEGQIVGGSSGATKEVEQVVSPRVELET